MALIAPSVCLSFLVASWLMQINYLIEQSISACTACMLSDIRLDQKDGKGASGNTSPNSTDDRSAAGSGGKLCQHRAGLSPALYHGAQGISALPTNGRLGSQLRPMPTEKYSEWGGHLPKSG